MRASEHDGTLGECPWCTSTEHRVYDDGDYDGDYPTDGERHFLAQCAECSQCSPGYPTIEKLREEWQDLRACSICAHDA